MVVHSMVGKGTAYIFPGRRSYGRASVVRPRLIVYGLLRTPYSVPLERVRAWRWWWCKRVTYDVVLLACYVVVCWLVAWVDPCRSATLTARGH